jgi:hypothetical protein
MFELGCVNLCHRQLNLYWNGRMAEWQNSGNGGMAYGMVGMAVGMVEWQNGRTAGMAEWHTEWHTEWHMEWRNGRRCGETSARGIVQKGIV